MRIALYLSKNTDLDLYAYFRDLEYRKSTHAKMLLRDFLYRRHTVRISPPRVNADTWLDTSLPRIITIPVRFGQEDKDLIEYFSDIPSGLRAKCMKSMLRALLTPYTQCAFHREQVEVYAPDTQEVLTVPVVRPDTDNTQALTCTMQTMQLMMMQMMQSMQDTKPVQVQTEEQKKPDFLNHRPDWGNIIPRVPKEEPQPEPNPEQISGAVVPNDTPKREPQPETPIPVLQPLSVSLPETTSAGSGAEGSDDDAIMKLFGVDY